MYLLTRVLMNSIQMSISNITARNQRCECNMQHFKVYKDAENSALESSSSIRNVIGAREENGNAHAQLCGCSRIDLSTPKRNKAKYNE